MFDDDLSENERLIRAIANLTREAVHIKNLLMFGLFMAAAVIGKVYFW